MNVNWTLVEETPMIKYSIPVSCSKLPPPIVRLLSILGSASLALLYYQKLDYGN